MKNWAGRGRRSFSLVELLAVMGIIALLMTLSLPAFNRMVLASNLNSAGRAVVDQINRASQEARTKNRPVRIYFYQTREGNDDFRFRAFQLFSVDPGETNKVDPLDKVAYLPQGMMISEDENFSTLFADPFEVDKRPTNGPPDKIGTVEFADDGYAFEFNTGGGADIQSRDNESEDAGSKRFLYIHHFRDPPVAGTGSRNGIAVRVDPDTGRPRVFRQDVK